VAPSGGDVPVRRYVSEGQEDSEMGHVLSLHLFNLMLAPTEWHCLLKLLDIGLLFPRFYNTTLLL